LYGSFFFSRSHFADVRAALRRREPGPHGADQQAAQGEDPSNNRFVHEAVSGVRGKSPETDPHLSQVLQEEQTCQRPELAVGRGEAPLFLPFMQDRAINAVADETDPGPLDFGTSRTNFSDGLRERESQREENAIRSGTGQPADADPTGRTSKMIGPCERVR
jgi:hypothetical protein